MSSLPRSLLLDCNGALQLYVMCTTAHSKPTQWKVCSREAGPGAVAGACRAGQRVRCTSTADRCVDRCSPRWCSAVYAAPAAALATWAGWACCWCWCLCQSAFGSNLYVCQLHQFRTSHASHCVCCHINDACWVGITLVAAKKKRMRGELGHLLPKNCIWVKPQHPNAPRSNAKALQTEKI